MVRVPRRGRILNLGCKITQGSFTVLAVSQKASLQRVRVASIGQTTKRNAVLVSCEHMVNTLRKTCCAEALHDERAWIDVVRDCPRCRQGSVRCIPKLKNIVYCFSFGGRDEYRLDVYARAQVTNRPRLAPKKLAVQNICAIPFFNVSCLEFQFHFHSRL